MDFQQYLQSAVEHGFNRLALIVVDGSRCYFALFSYNEVWQYTLPIRKDHTGTWRKQLHKLGQSYRISGDVFDKAFRTLDTTPPPSPSSGLGFGGAPASPSSKFSQSDQQALRQGIYTWLKDILRPLMKADAQPDAIVISHGNTQANMEELWQEMAKWIGVGVYDLKSATPPKYDDLPEFVLQSRPRFPYMLTLTIAAQRGNQIVTDAVTLIKRGQVSDNLDGYNFQSPPLYTFGGEDSVVMHMELHTEKPEPKRLSQHRIRILDPRKPFTIRGTFKVEKQSPGVGFENAELTRDSVPNFRDHFPVAIASSSVRIGFVIDGTLPRSRYGWVQQEVAQLLRKLERGGLHFEAGGVVFGDHNIGEIGGFPFTPDLTLKSIAYQDPKGFLEELNNIRPMTAFATDDPYQALGYGFYSAAQLAGGPPDILIAIGNAPPHPTWEDTQKGHIRGRLFNQYGPDAKDWRDEVGVWLNERSNTTMMSVFIEEPSENLGKHEYDIQVGTPVQKFAHKVWKAIGRDAFIVHKRYSDSFGELAQAITANVNQTHWVTQAVNLPLLQASTLRRKG